MLLVALMFSVGVSGCTSSSLSPVGPLATAEDAQFSRSVSAAVTAGSPGMEWSGPDNAHWWLNSPGADITVSNNSQRSPVVEMTTRVVPPPCGRVVEVVVDSLGSPPIRLVAGSAGKLLSLRLDVPLGQSKIIHLSVLTPACHIATDSRTLYAALYSLTTG